MANPTSQVAAAHVPFTENGPLWPLIGGATIAKTYQCGEMIGLRSDGYATSLDDSAPMRLIGVLSGEPVQVSAADASGANLVRTYQPRYLVMPLDASTASRATNIGAPVYAGTVTNGGSAVVSLSPGVNGNLVGYIEDVIGATPDVLTGKYVLIRPVTASGTAVGAGATPLSITAAATLTSGYANRPLLLNAAAGFAITLPVPTGSGNEFSFYVGTTVTSVGITISDGAAHLWGSQLAMSDKSASQPDVIGFPAVAKTTITLNGTTTGGIKGDKVVIKDIAANIYDVVIIGQTTGTAVTPFS